MANEVRDDAGTMRAPASRDGRRPRLARVCRRSGLLPLVMWARTALRQDVRILAYHRVLETAEPEDFRFDLDLVSASAEGFRAQLKAIRRHCSPLRFDELVDHLDRGKPLPPRSVLITFDDGYDDNYRVAFPLLRDEGMSAMFFVSTGHVDSGRPYAYDWLVYMLCVTDATRLQAPELGLDFALPVGLDARRRLASHLLDRIKTLGADAQLALIARLEREWALPSDAGHPDCRPMDWDQVREMHRGGMEFGSHGIDHRMLAKLDRVRMREEVADSKGAIERAIGAPVQAISYPVGGLDAYDDAVVDAVREAGYRVACSYVAGAEQLQPDTRYAMRRLPIERQMDSDWFEGVLALPEVFCYRSRHRGG